MEVAEVLHARLRRPQERAASRCRAGSHDPPAIVEGMGTAETRKTERGITENTEFLPETNAGPHRGLSFHLASNHPPIVDVHGTAVRSSESRGSRPRCPLNRLSFKSGQH